MADEDEIYGAEEHENFGAADFDQDDVDGGTRDDVILILSLLSECV